MSVGVSRTTAGSSSSGEPDPCKPARDVAPDLDLLGAIINQHGPLALHARQPHNNNQVPAQNTITALDADSDEFTLDFGFPAVTTRPLTPTVETTAQDARVARQNRSAEFRAQWHAEREVR